MDPGVIGRNEFGCFALDDIRFLDTGGGGLLGRNINAGSKGEPTQAKRGLEWATTVRFRGAIDATSGLGERL